VGPVPSTTPRARGYAWDPHGTIISGRPITWTFIHIWRVADEMIVEHWACRDDMGLLEQLRDRSG
jgi:hypothetical protein